MKKISGYAAHAVVVAAGAVVVAGLRHAVCVTAHLRRQNRLDALAAPAIL